jgi:hypothetical protein
MNSAYIDFLKHDIFNVAEYDQFELLFDALGAFLAPCLGKVAILERSYIYGGRSLFAPLVREPASAVVIDYRPESANTRANYQGSWLDVSGFDFLRATETVSDLGTRYRFSFNCLDAETLLIPNVLHHCRDFPALIADLQAALPNLERVFIFDSYLREGHQTPDDFCRYTPSALKSVMGALGFSQVVVRETGNIFDGILYLISQARWQLNNAPELAELRKEIDNIVPKLQAIRREECYRSLGRPHASLSTAYAISFKK